MQSSFSHQSLKESVGMGRIVVKQDEALHIRFLRHADPLDAIPMKVGHEKMDGASRYGGFWHTFDPEVPQTGAAIDDQNRAIRKAHLETGRVPPKA
jgi:hypothetical protein